MRSRLIGTPEKTPVGRNSTGDDVANSIGALIGYDYISGVVQLSDGSCA